jgi:rod shape-determining protein MreC
MRYIPVEPPPFFRRGPSPLARLAFFGLISIALLFVDTRFHYLEGVRHVAAAVLYPLQRAVQMPGEALAWVGGYFTSLRDLTKMPLKQLSVEHAAASGVCRDRQENARVMRDYVRRRRSRCSRAAIVAIFVDRHGADISRARR